MKALLLLGLMIGLLVAPAPAHGQAAAALDTPGSIAVAPGHRPRAATPAPEAPTPVDHGPTTAR